MDLASFVDDDLLREIIRDEISAAYLINADLISNYERFFENFLPDSLEYIGIVSTDIPPSIIKASLIKAKEPMSVKCFVSSKLPKGRILVILMKKHKDDERISVIETNNPK